MQLNKVKEIKQRTPEWFKAREGRFTASQINRLLGGNKKDGTALKATESSIRNYAHECAIDTLYGREPELEFLPKDMQRGVDLEPAAFEKAQEVLGLEFLDVVECGFFPIGDNSGASPDGLVGDTSILEIKCPQRAKFFKYVANGIDEMDPEYYAQVQLQMEATERSKCYFMNYIIDKGVEMWHFIEINRDDEFIKFMLSRIGLATTYKMAIIEKIKSNIQF